MPASGYALELVGGRLDGAVYAVAELPPVFRVPKLTPASPFTDPLAAVSFAELVYVRTARQHDYATVYVLRADS
jgi:hypothetical protein